MLSFLKHKKKAARLLQQHEYLDLLEGGLERHHPSSEETVRALALAHEVWIPLQLVAWEKKQLDMSAWRSRARGHVLVHIPTAIQDCFLVVVFDESSTTPDAYILFDIGAAYMPVSLDCPTLGLEGPTSEQEIRRVIPQLLGKEEPFVVVELRGGTYMQVYADEQGFHLEHQLVTPGAHYSCVDIVGPEVAIETLVSYAFGNHEWAYERRWEHIKL